METAINLALAALVLLGCVLSGLMWFAQRRLLRSAEIPDDARSLPPVSILKPLKGVDSDLEDNLSSFFRLDYPAYELLFGVDDPADPALEVARRVAAEHPSVPAAFVADDRRIGHNPKVNNLANILRQARYDLVLISDSNVRVAPATLTAMVEQIERPGTGMVTSLVRGVGGAGAGGVLERVQLNTWVMGGVAALGSLFGRVCAMGKSMLLRRSDLERIGGLERLGRYLAEDQVCGEEIRALGRHVVVSGVPVDNVLGRLSVSQFAARHLRWARIRRHISPFGYLGELLTNPLPPAVVLTAVEPGLATASALAAVVLLLATLACTAERRLGVARSPLRYPAVELARGLLVALLWPVPYVSRTVEWRGNRFRIGERTFLEPTGDGEPWPDSDEPEAVPVA